MTNTTSLNALNGWIHDGGTAESPLPMDRFRPNVVATGAPPWAEDGWLGRNLRIGAVTFRVVKACDDGTRLTQLATDNKITSSTAYRYLHEGIDVLAARKPSTHNALLAAKMAGVTHVNIDGTLLYTDKCHLPGPTPGVDLWWSGKHHHHGGNIQVVSTPDG